MAITFVDAHDVVHPGTVEGGLYILPAGTDRETIAIVKMSVRYSSGQINWPDSLPFVGGSDEATSEKVFGDTGETNWVHYLVKYLSDQPAVLEGFFTALAENVYIQTVAYDGTYYEDPVYGSDFLYQGFSITSLSPRHRVYYDSMLAVSTHSTFNWLNPVSISNFGELRANNLGSAVVDSFNHVPAVNTTACSKNNDGFTEGEWMSAVYVLTDKDEVPPADEYPPLEPGSGDLGVYINEQGVVKEALEYHKKHDGSVKEVLEGWINDGGVNKKFWPKGVGDYGDAFVMRVEPTIIGGITETHNNGLTLALPDAGSLDDYDAIVHWGDGNQSIITSENAGNISHTYELYRKYEIQITGTFPRLYYNNSTNSQKEAIREIRNWGEVGMTSMSGAFYGCTGMTSVSSITGNPSISSVTSMLRSNSSLTACDLSDIDFSQCTSLSSLFRSCVNLEILDVTGWDTSNVAFITNMFDGCSASVDPSGWNIGSLTNANDFDATMTTDTYSNLLINWEAQPHQPNVTIHFDAKYSSGASSARDALIADGWVLTDLGLEVS